MTYEQYNRLEQQPATEHFIHVELKAATATAPTQHVNCRRAFGRLDYNCPRCRELAAGAPARKGFRPGGAR